MSKIRKNWAFTWENGQGMIEFAFVLPILLILIIIMIDLGAIIYTQVIITNAAWEGARAGAMIADPEQGDQEIIGAIQSAVHGLDISNLSVEIVPAQNEYPRNLDFPEPRGASLSVTIQYQLELAFSKTSLPITGKAVTRMEYQNP